jgi:hypothetical protein
MRPPISAADLLEAFRLLRPANDEERRAIARVLGLEWKPRTAVPAASVEEAKPAVVVEAPRALKENPRKVEPPARPSASTPGGTAGFTISGPVKNPAEPGFWANENGAFEPVTAVTGVAPPVAPLFVPRWTRAILSTSLATRSPIGAPDVPRIVTEIASGRLLRQVPRLTVAAMALRVQILVDVGESMLPFEADQRDVIRAVKMVAGTDSVRVLKFTGTPLRAAGTDEMPEWQPYDFPPSDTHVLLLSDLGIGRPPMSDTSAGVDEWQAFARQLRRHRIACTAFVPYPANRWPEALVSKIRLVEWDRSTTASSVRFARRP